MSLLLEKNYFELFGLPVEFDVDTDKLSETYRQLQRQFHPDRFASATDHEKRIALQYATFINEAFECLKSPLLRAQYLMELVGINQKEHTMQNNTVFLLQQMEWRDRLDAANTVEQVEELIRDTREVSEEYLHLFEKAYQDKDFEEAQLNIDKMQFVSKFAKELQTRKQGLSQNI